LEEWEAGVGKVEDAPNVRLPSDQDLSGRSFGELEVNYLNEVLASGTLFAPKGQFVKRLERDFASYLGLENVVACSSGTGAIHSVLAACDFEPGSEVITSGITDMGAVAPILYQGLIPVFADVDAESGLLTAGSISERLSPRTRAIIVTHLFGNPCEVPPIIDLARAHGLFVLEDCAQAYGATSHGRLTGTMGDAAVFSLQQGKHITAGEGGLVATNQRSLADRVRRFINKAWDYDAPSSDHDFLALNYRMSELAGAVALAQLSRLDETVKQRVAAAGALSEMIEGIEGIRPTPVSTDSEHSYWRYPLLVDLERGPAALAATLRDAGVPSAPRYIKKPAFQCGVFVDQKTFGTSRYPFTLASAEALDYRVERFPGTFQFLDRVLVLPWNERFDQSTAELLATALREGVEKLRGGS